MDDGSEVDEEEVDLDFDDEELDLDTCKKILE